MTFTDALSMAGFHPIVFYITLIITISLCFIKKYREPALACFFLHALPAIAVLVVQDGDCPSGRLFQFVLIIAIWSICYKQGEKRQTSKQDSRREETLQ